MSVVSQGIVQIDIDQQDYLGVLLGDPNGFGSSAGSQALQAAPANTGTLKFQTQYDEPLDPHDLVLKILAMPVFSK